jgi:hypothetical protein
MLGLGALGAHFNHSSEVMTAKNNEPNVAVGLRSGPNGREEFNNRSVQKSGLGDGYKALVYLDGNVRTSLLATVVLNPMRGKGAPLRLLFVSSNQITVIHGDQKHQNTLGFVKRNSEFERLSTVRTLPNPYLN